MAFVAVLGGGLLALLLAGNEITIPGLDWTLSLGSDDASLSRPDGRVAVPLAARSIPAYHKISRDELWDPQKQDLAVAWMTPEAIERNGVLTSVTDIIGRVLAKEKPAGFVFTPHDFLPVGTRPGLVAGIPPGKRAVRVDVSKVDGLVGLLPGDRFDLLRSIPVGENGDLPKYDGIWGNQMALQANMSNFRKQSTVSVIVQNGTLITPVMLREIPVSSNSLTQGLVTRTRPVQEVFIAVSPSEATEVTEALDVGASLHCVPRSGHPDDPLDSVTPSSAPDFPLWSPFGEPQDSSSSMTLVEQIDGDDRVLQPVPKVPQASDAESDEPPDQEPGS